jgi:hypothetical protein
MAEVVRVVDRVGALANRVLALRVQKRCRTSLNRRETHRTSAVLFWLVGGQERMVVNPRCELLNRYGGNSVEGSNPSLSAT